MPAVGGTGTNESDMSLGRWRTIVGWGLCAFTFAAVMFAMYLSLEPGNYFFYREEDRAGWTHDPVHVAFVCGLIVAEAGCGICSCR